MATAVILGVGAVTAAILGRSIVRQGLFIGRGTAGEFVKGGFRAKMDRKEAIQVLGLK
jgi:DnaJ family protein C protein 19